MVQRSVQAHRLVRPFISPKIRFLDNHYRLAPPKEKHEPMLLKNSSIYMFAKIIPGVMAFTALSVYTHLLTPEQYGVYTLIFTAAMFVNTSIFNWLPVGMVRFWPGGTFTEATFISTLGVLYRALSLPIIILAVLIALFIDTEKVPYLMAWLVLLCGFVSHRFGLLLKTAQMQPTSYALMIISYSVLALALGTAFIYLGWGPMGLLIGVAAGMLLPSIIQTFRIWLKFDPTLYSPELTQKLMIYGMPLAASFLLDEIANVSDRYMLAWLSGEAEAGKYAVGYDLAGNSILMVMNAVNLAAYPMIVKLLDTEGKEAALEYFKTYAMLLLGLSIPAVVGLSLVGPNIVDLVIGDQYKESVTLLLPWVSSAIFFMGAGAFYMHLPFQLGNNNMGIFKIAGVVAVLNLVLNYFLIPKMGMQGAAIATLLSFMISVSLGYIFGRRVFPIPFPVKEVAKILFATLLMGLVLYYLKDQRGWLWLALQFISGLLIYLSASFLLNVGGVKQLILNRLQR